MIHRFQLLIHSLRFQMIHKRFRPNHLSLYQLTIERGTPLFTYPNPRTPEDLEQFSDLTIEKTKALGYHQYEVSSFTRNESYQGQHNQAYWKGADYIGIGPGAHGRLYQRHTLSDSVTRFRTFRILEPKRWMNSVFENGHGYHITFYQFWSNVYSSSIYIASLARSKEMTLDETLKVIHSSHTQSISVHS